MKIAQPAIWQSVGLHLVLLVGLALSVEFPNSPEPTPSLNTPQQPIVEAVVIDSAIIEAQYQRIEAQKQAAARAEQQRIEQARQQRLAEQRKQREAEQRRKKAAEEKRKAEQLAKQKAEQQRLQRERERKAEAERQQAIAREKAEAEKRAQEERRRREEAARLAEQRRLEEKMRQEQQARQQQQRREFILTETEKAAARIKAAIQNYLIGDNSMYGKTCTVQIRLASTGFVTNFSVVNGDAYLCTALKRSVEKQVKLPMSDDPDVNRNLRSITLTFSPTQ